MSREFNPVAGLMSTPTSMCSSLRVPLVQGRLLHGGRSVRSKVLVRSTTYLTSALGRWFHIAIPIAASGFLSPRQKLSHRGRLSTISLRIDVSMGLLFGLHLSRFVGPQAHGTRSVRSAPSSLVAVASRLK